MQLLLPNIMAAWKKSAYSDICGQQAKKYIATKCIEWEINETLGLD